MKKRHYLEVIYDLWDRDEQWRTAALRGPLMAETQLKVTRLEEQIAKLEHERKAAAAELTAAQAMRIAHYSLTEENERLRRVVREYDEAQRKRLKEDRASEVPEVGSPRWTPIEPERKSRRWSW